MESFFLNFGLISCKSTKKCAKLKILNKSENQKILVPPKNSLYTICWKRYQLYDISIYISYTRNLLVAFKFSNFHFYVQNCRFRALCCRFTANQAKIQKSTSNTIQPTHSHDRIIDLTKNTQKLSSPSVFIVFIYSLCQAPDHEYEDLSRAFFSKLSFCRKKTLNNEI